MSNDNLNWRGDLDEVRYYSTSLTTVQIQQIRSDTMGIAAYYSLDGDASDDSGNGYDGTLTGGALTAGANGDSNEAYLFDGNDKIEVSDTNDLDLTGGMTIAAWVKVNAFVNTDEIIVAKGSAYSLQRNGSNNTLSCIHGGLTSGGTSVTTTAFNDDTWHHVACVYTESQKMIYLDGTVETTDSASGTISTNSTSLTLGSADAAGQELNGSIDEIYIFNRALSADEIQDLKTSPP